MTGSEHGNIVESVDVAKSPSVGTMTGAAALESNTSAAALDAESLKKVRAGANALTKAAMAAVAREFPWYGELPKTDRAYVDLVIRAGINSFVQWFAHRDSAPSGVREMFDAAPVELTQTISLRQTLDLVRAVVAVIEDSAGTIAAAGQEREVREAALRFSRDVAFSAAEVYAGAAELRGAWDARLQAQALDALVEREAPEKLIAHFRALDWNPKAPVTVLVGAPPPEFSPAAMIALRRKLSGLPGRVLVGLQGDLLVMVFCPIDDAAGFAGRARKSRFGVPVAAATSAAAGKATLAASGGSGSRSSAASLLGKPGSLLDRATKGYASGLGASGTSGSGTGGGSGTLNAAGSTGGKTGARKATEPVITGLPADMPAPPAALLELFGPGPIVIGTLAPTIVEAVAAVAAAITGWQAARAWPEAPSPVLAADLLPERALLGDDAACDSLISDVFLPIQKGKNLLDTLSAYLESGRSLEAAARKLDIHVNTARYRLNNIAELTGWDPLVPREAYVLQVALTLGLLNIP